MNAKRRVVITGMGSITSFGAGVDVFWNSIISGKSGIDTIKGISLEGQVSHIAGEVIEYDTSHVMEPKEARRTDKYIKLGLIAADEAFKDSKIDKDNLEDPYRYGVIIGSGVGGFLTFEEQHLNIIHKGPTKCSPFTIPMIIANVASGRISMQYGFKGVNKTVVSACASSTHCIGDSFRTIQYGEADVMLAGGSESIVSTLGVGAFSAMRALSKRNDEPQKASRPFDVDRDGFVISEGAAIFVIEELEHAKARNAKIYAEIVGYGQSADAYDIVAPDPMGYGAEKAMEFALKDANVDASCVDYINAHGTSTGLGDIAESKAIERLFKDKEHNKRLKVSSTKSMHGHLLGATGSTESIACVKAINEGIIPPTINLDNQDERVGNLDYVPNKAIKQEVKYAMKNSFGFGGQNACLLFKKFED